MVLVLAGNSQLLVTQGHPLVGLEQVTSLAARVRHRSMVGLAVVGHRLVQTMPSAEVRQCTQGVVAGREVRSTLTIQARLRLTLELVDVVG